MATCRRGRRSAVAAATAAAIGAGAAFAEEAAPGHSAPNASGPAEVASAAFHGTAYLKTSNTVTYADRPGGFARLTAQAQIDQCNDIRTTGYHLSPASQPESVMAALDVSVEEKWFSTNEALSVDTRQLLTLPDMRRWSSDLDVALASGTGALPAVPPDCARTIPPSVFEIPAGFTVIGP